jgi:D-alanine-D-alanine ligase
MQAVLLHNVPPRDASAADQDVLVQAAAVRQSLIELGYQVTSIGCTLDLAAVDEKLRTLRPDVVFQLVESLGATDRLMAAITLLLEALQIPFTGAGTDAILATGDKRVAKRRLRAASLPTADWLDDTSTASDIQRWNAPLVRDVADLPHACGPAPDNGRMIVKAACEHASLGLDEKSVIDWLPAVSVLRLLDACQRRTGRPHLVERYVEGREFNLSLLAESANFQVLPPAEILFSGFRGGQPRIVGYRAKWEEGSFEYEHTPRRFDFPPTDHGLLVRLIDLAQQCWQLFGLQGYARVDYRVDDAGRAWILEVNVNPCLSPDAGFAAALSQAGLNLTGAVGRIVAAATLRHTRGDAAAMEPQTLAGGGSLAIAAAPPFSRDDSGSNSPTNRGAAEWSLRSELVPGDAAAIERIVCSTGFFRADETEVALELVQERLSKGPDSGYKFVVAESAGRVVGYCCYGQIPCTLGSYDLYWIVVDPDCQRLGIGRRLLDEAERRIIAQQGRLVYIETSGRPQYQPTRQFYERCGYEVAATMRDFYQPGDDKVVLCKVLGTTPRVPA